MKTFLPIEISVAVASIASILFLLSPIPNNYTTIVTIGLLLIVLIIINRLYLGNGNQVTDHSPALNTVVITLLYLFVMFILLVTGNIFSPFLILVHLTIISTGLFIKQSASVWIFIGIASVLFVQVLLRSDIQILIYEDPWTPIVYGISCLAIFPLLTILIHKYHVRSKLINLLTSRVLVIETREKAILESVNELIFVTNLKLELISINNAACKALDILATKYLFTPLDSIFTLYNHRGEKYALADNISKTEILTRTSTIVSPLVLHSPKISGPLDVSLEIKPITGLAGDIEQISFIITRLYKTKHDPKRNASVEHVRSSLEQRRYSLLNKLKNVMHDKQNEHLIGIINTEWDLVNALRIAHETMQPATEVVDVSVLWNKVVVTHNLLLEDLEVSTRTDLPTIPTKTEHLDPVNVHVTVPTLNKDTDLRIVSNQQWLRLLLEKLFEVQIYLSTEKDKNVYSSLRAQDDAIIITMSTNNSSVSKEELYAFFSADTVPFPLLADIPYASGLEGLLAYEIARYLTIPLLLDIEKEQIRFTISLPRTSGIQ